MRRTPQRSACTWNLLEERDKRHRRGLPTARATRVRKGCGASDEAWRHERWVSGSRQRTPRGLAHVRCGRDQPLLDAAVAGDGGQYTTASRLGCVQDELAVRRNARAFVA